MGMSAMQGDDVPAEVAPAPEQELAKVAPGTTDTRGLDNSSQEQLGVDALRQIPEIQPETWQNLNESERIAALQNVESQMANIQGRPVSEVRSTEAGPGAFGYFDPNSGQINIGSYALQNEPVQENVDTVVHEGRHAYQDYAVKHPGFHPNQAEVDAWRENMLPGNYLSAQEYGQELYQSQPIEADAWQYGNSIASGVYGDNQ
jgi:hypothetical protein